MKRLLALLFLVGMSAGIAALVRARRSDATRYQDSLAQAEARFAKEREEMNQALEEARSRPPEIVTKTVTVQAPPPPPPTAAEILKKLIELKSGAGFADIRAQRQAVVLFEALVSLGPIAFPAIQEFLLRFEDADYTPDSRRRDVSQEVQTGMVDEARRKWWQPLAIGERPLGDSHARRAPLSFSVPPTLRLGLFDVLHAIGGDTAEEILLDQLQRTGRAVEVAYLAHTLKDMSGNEHSEAILQTTHELLLAPPQPQTGALVDAKAKDYLYAVLEMFDDITFSPSAIQLLVDPSGQLDHHAFEYLGRTLQDNIVPVLTYAWSNPALTNDWDRGALAGAAMPHASTNVQASQLIRATILENSFPRDLRIKMVRALEEPVRSDPSPETTLSVRIQLLNDLFGQLQDVELLQETSLVRQRLVHQSQERSKIAPSENPIPRIPR